ncbi:hypothetical protein F5Y00DRAFT_258342 [Daldinia vernicosa]|uniref:uncharacterized protein n=1 Tax=Daldinia vernicosa TaxID=114800 RepID=UPI0020078985|nr:uncharacterized protein F5Y00DRAFT_258342 [Daldinia vernicosa]KAI0852498.1 hypothetical protein F5Y00DRAFT_258342 [Daldinia vernicosa]
MANSQYVGRPEASSQQLANSSSSLPSPIHNRTSLPHYFIVRPGTTKHTASGTVTTPGPIVPLIAVDQLPAWLDLLGVPRELSVEQTVGLRNLGTAVRNPEFYQVYMHNDLHATTPPAAHQGDCHIQTEQVRRCQAQGTNDSRLVPVDIPTTSAPPSASSSTTLTSAEEESTASSHVDLGSEPSTTTSGPNSNNATTSLHLRLPPRTVSGSTPPTNPYPFIPAPAPAPVPFLPSWLPPSTRTKPHHLHATSSHTAGSPSSTYCKHWCHRGTCRWGAQCRYAHSMPTTAAGLREVGLAHHPAWYTTAVNMAFGPGGFASTRVPRWCPPQQNAAAGGVLRCREKEKEKERVEKREKANNREKKKKKKQSAGAEAGVGKGKNGGGGGGGDGGDGASAEAEQRKEDAAEEKDSAASGQGQKAPDVVEKLVEI